MKNDKITSNFDEVARAEREARENRRELEETLLRFGHKVDDAAVDVTSKVTSKKEEVLHKVEDKVSSVKNVLDSGAHRIDETINHGKQILDEKLSRFDDAIGNVGGEFDTSITRVKDNAVRLRSGVVSVLDEADRFVLRVESIMTKVRQDFIASANDVLTSLERIVERFRLSLTQGTGQIRQILDRAETTVNQATDPSRLVSNNPKAAIGTLLFAGMVVGLFMRKSGSRAGEVVRVRHRRQDEDKAKDQMGVRARKAA